MTIGRADGVPGTPDPRRGPRRPRSGITFILCKVESYCLSPRLTARHVKIPGFLLIVTLLSCEHVFGFKAAGQDGDGRDGEHPATAKGAAVAASDAK